MVSLLKDQFTLFYCLEIGITSLPGIGVEFYAQCLKFHTSTNMTVEQIHQLGLEEVERIELEMKEIVTELGYTNISLQQFTDIIRSILNTSSLFLEIYRLGLIQIITTNHRRNCWKRSETSWKIL